MCTLKLSKIGIVNALCCAIGWLVGLHLIWFRNHPGIAGRAWDSLCRLVLAWWSGMGGP